MGLYVADMLLNFNSLSLPWLRLIWIAATLAYFVVASVTQVENVACYSISCILTAVLLKPINA